MRMLICGVLVLAVGMARAALWSEATFVTSPDPIRNNYAFTFAGCGYVPDSEVYFYGTEANDPTHYQEFLLGATTDAQGCFATAPEPWLWGAEEFDVLVLQARPDQPKLHRVMDLEFSVIP